MKILTALELVAFHESGHAVVALTQDVKVINVEVCVDEQDRPFGWTRLGSLVANLDVGRLLPILLAGEIVSRRVDPRGTLPLWVPPGEHPTDTCLIDVALKVDVGFHAPPWRRRLRRAFFEAHTMKLIEVHWSAIHTVADSLAFNKVLDGRRIRGLIEAASRSW